MATVGQGSIFYVPFGLKNLKGTMEVTRDTTQPEKLGYCKTPIFAHETYPVTCTLNPTDQPADDKAKLAAVVAPEIKFRRDGKMRIVGKYTSAEYGKVYYTTGPLRAKYGDTVIAEETGKPSTDKEDEPLRDPEDKDIILKYQDESYQKQFRKIVRWDFGDGTQIEGYSATHYYKVPGRYKISCTFYDIDRKGVDNAYSITVIVKQVIPTMLEFDTAFDESVAFKPEIHCSAIEHIARIHASLSNNVKNNVDIIAKRIYEPDEEENPSWDDVKDLPFPHLRKYYSFLASTKEYYNDTERLWDERISPVNKYTPEYDAIYGKFLLEKGEIVFDSYYVNPYKTAQSIGSLTIIDPACDITQENTEKTIPCTVKPVSTIGEIPEGYIYAGKKGYVDVYYRNDFLSDKNVVSFFYDVENIALESAIESAPNFLNMMPLGIKFAIVENNKEDIDFSLTLNGFVTSFEGVDKLVQLSLLKDYDFSAILVPYIKKSVINYYIHEQTEDPLLMEQEKLILSEYSVEDYFQGNYYIPKDFIFSNEYLQLLYGPDNDSLIESVPYEGADYLRAFKIICKTIFDARFAINDKTIILNHEVFDLDKVVVPTEQTYSQDIDKLIEVYMPHPVFEHADNLKGVLHNTFKTNNLLNYILTKGQNFFDDHVNVKSSYVTDMLQTLEMMGQDISDYSVTNFEGVNEVKDLTRILTMNHSELMGNYIDEPFDIKVKGDIKGKHIGERILVDDILYTLTENKFEGDKRFSKGKVTKIERIENKKKVTYNTVEPVAIVIVDDYSGESRIASFADITPREIKNGEAIYCIEDYDDSWGWNLLLPSNWAEEDKAKIINSYYSFYLLVPPTKKERVGNFLDETTITEEITDPNKWIDEDGITFRALQKVIHSKI